MDNKKSKLQVAELTEQLEKGIVDLFESGNYQQYLKMMSRFHRYSFRNTMLILMQNENASMVAGYKKWITDFKRHVKEHEHGIKIFAPAPYKARIMAGKKDEKGEWIRNEYGGIVREEKEILVPAFKVVHVFDVSQTEGDPLPELASDLNSKVDKYSLFFETLKQTAICPVAFEDITDGSKGYYHFGEKRIAIKTGMSEAQTIKTFIHEMAHSMLHPDKETGKDAKTREVEAESVAYVVCSRYGIDTSDYSFGYIAGWSGDKELPQLQSSMTVIQETSQKMIDSIDAKYKELERGIATPELASNKDIGLKEAYASLQSASVPAPNINERER
jgi:antirestriction protein ArdC